MAKKKKLGKWVVRVKAGNATVNVHGRTKKAAKANGKRFVKKYMKNIEQGFYEGGIFHPIRGSSDYSAARAGEGRSRSAKRTRQGKAIARGRAASSTRKAGRPR